MSSTSTPEEGVIRRVIDEDVIKRIEDFKDPGQEWRRLFSEFYGTFFLVLVAAGGGMMGQAFPNTISRTAAVVGPGLMVMGDHLVHGEGFGRPSEPGRQSGFRRPPGLPVDTGARLHRRPTRRRGSRVPLPAAGRGRVRCLRVELRGRADTTPVSAMWMEAVLTLGLVSVILGTASGAQNVGLFGAIAVAATSRWPVSGAARSRARR